MERIRQSPPASSRKTGGDVFSVDEIELNRLENPNTSVLYAHIRSILRNERRGLERARRVFQPSAILFVAEQGE